MPTLKTHAAKTLASWAREKQTTYAVREKISSRRRFWVMVSAVWLEIMVLAFIFAHVSRLKTPIMDRLVKAIDMIVRQ